MQTTLVAIFAAFNVNVHNMINFVLTVKTRTGGTLNKDWKSLKIFSNAQICATYLVNTGNKIHTGGARLVDSQINTSHPVISRFIRTKFSFSF